MSFAQPGRYQVDASLSYDTSESTSAGRIQETVTIDNALLSESSSYDIYVLPEDALKLPLNIDAANDPANPRTMELDRANELRVLLQEDTDDLRDVTLYVTVFMDGWILDQQEQSADYADEVGYTLDLPSLHSVFNTIDVASPFHASYTESADLIRISLMMVGKNAAGKDTYLYRTVTIDEERPLLN